MPRERRLFTEGYREMKLKAVSGIMLTLLLIGMLTLAFNIQSVKAGGPIYIKADGSIDPPTANITSVDNVTYTFTGNINDEIVVERSNIVVDGAGYTVQGTGTGTGINLSGTNNVTIKNTKIKSFDSGILLPSFSNNNSVIRNNITNNTKGISISNCSNHSIIGNNITQNNDDGIYLYNASYNVISGNNITNNHNYAITLVWSSNNNTIAENNITNNDHGIHLFKSSSNSISGNSITANNGSFVEWLGNGIRLYDSANYNTISGNYIAENSVDGIQLYNSANHNTISGNYIAENNAFGIRLYNFSNYNNITGNNVTNNHYGIELADSSNNTIYHNNFVNNILQVTILGYGYPNNIWDDGYPSGGNYWSDYVGTDFYGGVYQNISGSDGIGDTPYAIDVNNIDHYPLIPWLWGDLDDDGDIDFFDLGKMVLVYSGFITGPPELVARADLDGDCDVDFFDLGKMILIYSGYL